MANGHESTGDLRTATGTLFFADRKGNHTWFSSVPAIEAAKPSSEVVVPKAVSLVGAGVSL